MRIKKRMTAANFETVRPLLRTSAERIEAARLVLVEGQTLQAAGAKFGWSRQTVAGAVNVVWRTFGSYYESQRAAVSASTLLPPGWEQVTLVAPLELIERFREEVAQAVPQPVKTKAKTKLKPKSTHKENAP